MQSTLKIEQEGNHTIHISSDHLKARIIMNPRDAMVHAVVDEIDADHAHSDLQQLHTYLYEQCGGKTSLQLPVGVNLNTAVAAGFSASPSYGKCNIITRENMTASIQAITPKVQVQAILANIDADVFQFVSNDELRKNPKALFEFKKANAEFVTDEKEQSGIYSVTAEKHKLTSPHVRHFAIKKGDQILASAMFTVVGNHLYLADFIVHQDRQDEKFAQAIIAKSYQAIFKEFPDIQDLWLIAGGDGTSPKGKHIHHDILKSQVIDETVQRDHGIIIKLTGPGPVLLNAANRSLKEPHHTLDQKAMKKWSLSEPQPQTSGEEQVAEKSLVNH